MAKPFGGNGPPAALFHDSRDRGGTHPRGHPAGWSGILQADAYAGFNGLYATGRAPAPLTEASCWAHGGARFFELADLAKAMRAPMAIEAVRRIDGNRRRPWSSPDAYIVGRRCGFSNSISMRAVGRALESPPPGAVLVMNQPR